MALGDLIGLLRIATVESCASRHEVLSRRKNSTGVCWDSQLRAPCAATLVTRISRPCCVAALAADMPAINMGDHRTELTT
jgi:hypothetical protein